MLSIMSLKFRLFSFLSRNKSKPTETVTSSHGPVICNKLLTENKHFASSRPDLSPVSIQTQSLALRKRKPQEMQALA